jgi:hypothetical protein
MPRALCARRVIRRSIRGGDRPDLAPGCREKIDGAYLAFLRYVWTFDQIQVPKMQAALRDFGGNVSVVTLRRASRLRRLSRISVIGRVNNSGHTCFDRSAVPDIATVPTACTATTTTAAHGIGCVRMRPLRRPVFNRRSTSDGAIENALLPAP